MSTLRAGQPGATRLCPHCKATVLESASICPGCRHHLRFSGGKQLAEESYTALSVDGSIAHRETAEPCEYCIVLDITNERGEQVMRQVVGVGALQPGELRRLNLSVQMLPLVAQVQPRREPATAATGTAPPNGRPAAGPVSGRPPTGTPSPTPSASGSPGPGGAPRVPVPGAPTATGSTGTPAAAAGRPAAAPAAAAGSVGAPAGTQPQPSAATNRPATTPAIAAPAASSTSATGSHLKPLNPPIPGGAAPPSQRLRIFRKP